MGPALSQRQEAGLSDTGAEPQIPGEPSGEEEGHIHPSALVTGPGTGTLLTSAGHHLSAQGVQFPCHRGGDWGPETWEGVPRGHGW